MPELKPLVNGYVLSVYAVPELVLMTHFIQPSVGFNHGIKPPLMPFASLVNKAGYKFSIILPPRNTFGKFFALDIFTHWELLSMLEGAPATHPLYHRGSCQARMKLRSNHKTRPNKLLKLFAFDKLLVRPHIENKWAVGFPKHRLNLIWYKKS